MQSGYVTPQEACMQLGICKKTLERWRKAGKIKYIQPGNKKHFYYIKDFFEDDHTTIKTKTNYIYSRVSTRNQKENLKTQEEYLQQQYPDHISIRDIGSGLNFKRKGLNRLLEQADKGLVGEVVVSYRDRLCRFGFDLIRWFIENRGGKIVVLNNEKSSPGEELVQDLISIITVFSARIYGLRSYKHKIKKDKTIIARKTETDN